jgi:5-methylcytosine-specific restriction endonuclease McrA
MDCPTCGTALATRQGMRQHHSKVHGESLPNRTCKGCDEQFYDPKARRVYCDECDPNAGSNNGNWRGGKTETDCVRCGEAFEYYPSDKPGVYCSKCVERSSEFLGTPQWKLVEAPRETRACKHCREEMSVLVSDIERGEGVFCSHDCRSQWTSENVVGENHHHWEGGSIPYGQSWWRVRREARSRDEHTCRLCRRSADELGREPDVHHIERVRDFENPTDAHTLDNVVCLCRSCHRRVEEGVLELPSQG